MKKTLIFATLSILLISAVTIHKTAIPFLSSHEDVLSQTTQKNPVTQTINYGEGRQEKTTTNAVTGQSVLDVLSGSKQITIKQTSLGKLVESIEGITNGTDNKYWIYYINGKEANIGASENIVQPNDIIEWKFQAYEQ